MGVRRVAPLCVLGVFLVPLGLAQPPAQPVAQMPVDPFPGPVPVDRTLTTTLRLAFSCSQDEITASPNERILVSFATGAVPPFVNLTLVPGEAEASPTDAAHCLDETMRHFVNASVQILLGRTAPAFEGQRVPISAAFTFTGLDGAPTRRTGYMTNATFVPGYRSSFEVESDWYSLVASGPGRSAEFHLNVTSRANGESKATFSVLEADGMNVTLPEPVAIPFTSPATRGAATVRIAIPDALYDPPGAHTVRVGVTFASTDARANATSEATLVLTVEDPPRPPRTPGPEAGLAIALVAWVALRRRRPT
jgi:hypothetical protein